MAVQEDVLPIQKMALTLVLFTLGTVVAVFCGQFIYLAVQDVEDQTKLVHHSAGMESVLLGQELQIEEYRLLDADQKRISIPIEVAKKLVAGELSQGRR